LAKAMTKRGPPCAVVHHGAPSGANVAGILGLRRCDPEGLTGRAGEGLYLQLGKGSGKGTRPSLKK